MSIDQIQAGYELDKAILDLLFDGCAPSCVDEVSGEPVMPNFSTEIQWAWAVVEKLGMQCGFEIHTHKPFAMLDGQILRAETVPLAICRLALWGSEK